jgi:hypothetical protein
MSLHHRFFSLFVSWVLVLAWSTSAQAYRERLLLAVTEGTCTLRVEADEQAQTLRLRVLPETAACSISKPAMQALLTTALAQAAGEKPEERYTSLFLGRLVEYPWLSSHLAASACRDPRWDRKKGRPMSRNVNVYVRDLLASPEVFALFDEALAVGGYRVTAVEVEKVLVGRWHDLPLPDGGPECSGKVPFDAMVWLVLGKRE